MGRDPSQHLLFQLEEGKISHLIIILEVLSSLLILRSHHTDGRLF